MDTKLYVCVILHFNTRTIPIYSKENRSFENTRDSSVDVNERLLSNTVCAMTQFDKKG